MNSLNFTDMNVHQNIIRTEIKFNTALFSACNRLYFRNTTESSEISSEFSLENEWKIEHIIHSQTWYIQRSCFLLRFIFALMLKQKTSEFSKRVRFFDSRNSIYIYIYSINLLICENVVSVTKLCEHLPWWYPKTLESMFNLLYNASTSDLARGAAPLSNRRTCSKCCFVTRGKFDKNNIIGGTRNSILAWKKYQRSHEFNITK